MRTVTNAQRITERMEATRRDRTGDSPIYTIVMDDHNVHCMTDPMLDAWWASLRPEDKAALYELHLEGVLDEPEPEPELGIEFCLEPLEPKLLQITVCGISMTARTRPEFMQCLAELARASQGMFKPVEVVVHV